MQVKISESYSIASIADDMHLRFDATKQKLVQVQMLTASSLVFRECRALTTLRRCGRTGTGCSAAKPHKQLNSS